MIRTIPPGTTTLPWIGSLLQIGAAVYASATDLENQGTATNTSLLMSPGMMRHHPGFPKAWVRFTVTGGVVAAYNVSTATGVARNGTGDYTVRFITHFSSSNGYSAHASLIGAGDNFTTMNNSASGSIDVFARDASAGLEETGVSFLCLACFGDQ